MVQIRLQPPDPLILSLLVLYLAILFQASLFAHGPLQKNSALLIIQPSTKDNATATTRSRFPSN